MIEPVISAWRTELPSATGHQGEYAMREIVKTILCQNRTGCLCEYLPPKRATYYYFAAWHDDGTRPDPFTTSCVGSRARAESDQPTRVR